MVHCIRMRAITVAVLLLAGTLALGAQSRNDEDWVRIDPEPEIESAGEAVGLAGARILAGSDGRQAIGILREMLDAGSISGRHEEAIDILRTIAGQGVTVLVAGGGTSDPLIRLEATRLLGRLGGPDAREALYEIIELDPEPAVVAAGVRAVGALGEAPEERFYDALTARLRTMNVSEPDDRLAYAVLDTVLEMHDSAWAVEDPDLYEAIIGVARGRYVPEVRRKAVQVLESLRED